MINYQFSHSILILYYLIELSLFYTVFIDSCIVFHSIPLIDIIICCQVSIVHAMTII
jgi:hypothetical protein